MEGLKNQMNSQITLPGGTPLSQAEPWTLLTVDQAAGLLQTSGRMVRDLIARGDLRATKVGSLLRVRRRWIDEYVDREVEVR